MLTLSLQVADIPSLPVWRHHKQPWAGRQDLTVLQDAVVDAVGHVKVVGTLVEEEELLVLRAGACMKGPCKHTLSPSCCFSNSCTASSRARRLPVEELLEDVEGVEALKALEACLTTLQRQRCQSGDAEEGWYTDLHVFHVAEGIILLPLLLIAENLVGLSRCQKKRRSMEGREGREGKPE